MPADLGNSSGIKSTVKTLKVLKLFSMQKSIWSVQEIVEALGYHKSSIQRIVTTLEAEGFLARVAKGKGRYRLGPVVLFLGGLAKLSSDLRSIAQPVLSHLVERVQETAYLCVVDGHQSLYIEKVECLQPIRIVHALGKRNPLHCTGVGKALLSGMSQEQIERLIAEEGLKAYTPNTITSPQRLLEEIETVRARGVAYDNEELDSGVRCVAAPIFDQEGKVAAAISVSGPTQRLTPEKMAGLEAQVKAAAAEISYQYGCPPREPAATANKRPAR